MTIRKFNIYPFSISTEILINNHWENVLQVDFLNDTINNYNLEEIQDIRN